MVLIPEMTAAISAPPRFAYAVFGISASDTPTKVETKKIVLKNLIRSTRCLRLSSREYTIAGIVHLHRPQTRDLFGVS